jgi:hypothetical protein
MGNDGRLNIVRSRLGKHGLALETDRWSRNTYDHRFCDSLRRVLGNNMLMMHTIFFSTDDYSPPERSSTVPGYFSQVLWAAFLPETHFPHP